MAKARKGTELSVKLGNVRGTGASLFSQFKEAGINVVASCCYQIESEAFFTIVPDNIEEAERVLRGADLTPNTQDVLLLEMPNEPGAFAHVLQEIARIGVDVRSAYATTTSQNVALAIVKTEDDAKVMAALGEKAEEKKRD